MSSLSSYGYNNNNNYKYSYSNNKQKKKFFSETGNKVTGITSTYDYNHNNKPSSNANIYNKNTFPESYEKNSLSKSVLPIYSYEDLNEKYNNEYFDNKINKYNKNDYNNESNSNSNLINRELNSIITSTIGLTNLGNTCFMNTCLQNLIHSEDFIKRLISKKDSINRSTPISYYFFNLCKELAKSTRSVSPNKFKEKFGLKHHLFAGYGQNDTQEFCRVLLEDMNTELNEVKKKKPYIELKTYGKSKIQCDREFDENFKGRENSIIMDSFYGQIINIFTCKCGFKDYSFQKVLDLPLLLQNNNNSVKIENLLEEYFEEEEIKFETKCEKCGKKRVHKKEIKFSQPPNILILSLQRINNRTKRKNNCCVIFPEILNIQKFLDEDCGHYNDNEYVLYGIGNHSGTINFGHYYAYIKLNDKKWYEFNDSHVRKISEGIDTRSITAYTLFYKKRI